MVPDNYNPPTRMGDPMANDNDGGHFNFAREALDISEMLPGLKLHEPTALILDCNNLFKRAKMNGFAIDYGKLANIFHSRCDLRRMEAYSAVNRDTPDEQKRSAGWVSYMQSNGYAVFTKDVKTQINEQHELVKKGNMDIEITCGALGLSPGFGHIILGTCDGDFVPLVHELRKGGLRKVSVLGVMGRSMYGMSEKLMGSANNFYDLARLRDHVEYIPPHRSNDA